MNYWTETAELPFTKSIATMFLSPFPSLAFGAEKDGILSVYIGHRVKKSLVNFLRFERFKIQDKSKILKTNENRLSLMKYNSWEVGRDRI